jgi:hypothetical protein
MWPDVSLEELPLSEAPEQPEGSLTSLATPLAIQRHPSPGHLTQAVFRVLGQDGYWYLVDVIPTSMPAHWVFAFFPKAWSYARHSLWSAYDFYNGLRRAGFRIVQEEHTYHEPVTLRVVLEIAPGRPGLLAALADEPHQEGLRRLEEAAQEQGQTALVSS